MTLLFAAAAAVFVVLPLIVFRGRTLVLVLCGDLAVCVVAAAVWRHTGGFEPFLSGVVFFAVLLAVWAIALNVAHEIDIRWSATRGAVVALLVYALLVPAMLRTPIDGDEPFYLLMTESLVHDFDLDLRNQYAALDRSATGRTDLRPQEGDPVGPRGEQYSRHEPLLPLLLVPGYLIGRLPGAVATIALCGALLIRSTIRFLEDEGVADRTIRSLFPLVAFGPPIVFYAARIWPEVPAALCFVEALRGVRQRRPQRWIPALLLLAMLKLRFVLVALPLVIRAVSRSRRHALIGAGIVVVPLLILWLISGRATSVHSLDELRPSPAWWYARGLLGLILDGAAGLVFQAPLYVLGIFAFTRWRAMPDGFRLGCLVTSLYILLLAPRWEWHGGWAPPLRYLVFLMPVLVLGAAFFWQRWSAASKALVAAVSAALAIHGVAYPWRLFRVAGGENGVGEWLSRLYQSDFSRLFPSFIRVNAAAAVASVILAVALAVAFLIRRRSLPFVTSRYVPALAAAALAAVYVYGQKAGARVDFEDAHVVKRGGELYPHQYTVSRFLYRGGWVARRGHSLSFLAKGGRHELHYTAGAPVVIELTGARYTLLPGGSRHRTVPIHIPREGRVELLVVSGEVILDRLVAGR